jgi:aromatic-L-amino-acid decarboxylase
MLTTDLIHAYESSLAERPVFPRVDRDVLTALLEEPFPGEGRGIDWLFQCIHSTVIPNSTAVAHPRFLGYVLGPPNGIAPFADAVAAALNQNCNFWQLSPAANVIETKVLRWFARLFDYPKSAGGIVTTGGSMGTQMALSLALTAACPGFRESGLQSLSAPLAVYTSSEAHQSVEKAVVLAGLGRDSLRRIPVDSEFRMNIECLREAIRKDRARGTAPLCVVAACGTVVTGAIDPIAAVAKLCRDEGIWLHVDGAYGGFFVLSNDLKARIQECSLADSLSIDPHKMLFAPLDAGCLLVRDGECLKSAFAFPASYLPAAEDVLFTNFMDSGPQLSRSFRAFKIWCSLEVFGTEAFRHAVDRTRSIACYLEQCLGADPAFELLAPVTLNAVCFRLRELDEEGNQGVLDRLATEGTALLGAARVNGVVGLRACIANYRTSREDIDRIVSRLRQLALRSTSEMENHAD